MKASALADLRNICSADRVLIDDESLRSYGLDSTTVYNPAPCAVVLPESTEEVQAVVHWANTENVAIVPSGGRTGLSGGAIAKDGELVVAMDRMNKILDFNAVDRTLSCQAGTITQQISEYAEQRHLHYPVNFASAGSSQIGGNIATNAGGINVIRYGMTREWVLGLTVVTGTGDVLNLNQGLRKNNTGYDFRHLFIGSEGTLGIICETTLGLTHQPQGRTVQLLGVPNFQAIMAVMQIYSGKLLLSAFEFFSDLALSKVMGKYKLTAPLTIRTPYYVLLEFDGTDDNIIEQSLALFEKCRENKLVLDGVVSQNLLQTNTLWRLREDISETLASSQPYKNDISVRLSKMSDFIEAVEKLVYEVHSKFEIIWFGHIGDGNLHLNILKPEDMPVSNFNQLCADIGQQVGRLIANFGGSVSAEHGIGLIKKNLLRYSRSEAEIALMREVKQVFDPNGILNPNKIF